jgi:hypothetical protein
MNSSTFAACWLKILIIFLEIAEGEEAFAKKFAERKGIEATVIFSPA